MHVDVLYKSFYFHFKVTCITKIYNVYYYHLIFCKGMVLREFYCRSLVETGRVFFWRRCFVLKLVEICTVVLERRFLQSSECILSSPLVIHIIDPLHHHLWVNLVYNTVHFQSSLPELLCLL